MNIVEQVIEQAGGFDAVRQHFNITRQGLKKWIAAGAFPPYRVLPAWELTNRSIPLHEIDPVLYPDGVVSVRPSSEYQS